MDGGILDPVIWRYRIAVVMLMILAALPLAGTICAMTCLSGSSAVATHHEDGQDCESSMATSSDSSDASPGARIGVLSDYGCRSHSSTLPQMATTAAQRADLAVIAAPAASGPVHPLFGSITASDAHFRYTPPPGTAPPTATPLVLRV
jgi:hypothetical protein